jgi:deoxyribonucleoside regulator
MPDKDNTYDAALKVAQLYYYHDMNVSEIAEELDVSRAKASRLLNHARDQGLVEIRVIDRRNSSHPIESALRTRYRALHSATAVRAPENASEEVALARVAQRAAAEIGNNIFEENTIVGISWGKTLLKVSMHLVARPLHGLKFVQLHGNGYASHHGNAFAPELLRNFATAFGGSMVLLPTPAFFANEETREALWEEPTIKAVLGYRRRANVLLFSVGTLAESLEDITLEFPPGRRPEITDLREEGIVGALSTVFYRHDGTYRDLSINRRTSGPDLDLYRTVHRSVCVAAKREKVPALHAALKAGFISDLFVDERSAELLLQEETPTR